MEDKNIALKDNIKYSKLEIFGCLDVVEILIPTIRYFIKSD